MSHEAPRQRHEALIATLRALAEGGQGSGHWLHTAASGGPRSSEPRRDERSSPICDTWRTRRAPHPCGSTSRATGYRTRRCGLC